MQICCAKCADLSFIFLFLGSSAPLGRMRRHSVMRDCRRTVRLSSARDWSMNGRSSGYSSIILAKTGDRNSRPTYFCKGGGEWRYEQRHIYERKKKKMVGTYGCEFVEHFPCAIDIDLEWVASKIAPVFWCKRPVRTALGFGFFPVLWVPISCVVEIGPIVMDWSFCPRTRLWQLFPIITTSVLVRMRLNEVNRPRVYQDASRTTISKGSSLSIRWGWKTCRYMK